MSAYSTVVLADSPTMYFRLDESGAGPFVDVANAHNATPSGTIVTATSLLPAERDAAAAFDWNGTLKQADTSFAISGAPMTVECWVNCSGFALDPSASGYFTTAYGGTNLLLGSSGAGANGWAFGFLTSTVELYWAHHGVGDYHFAYTFFANTTYHFVLVMTTATNLDVYVNGVFLTSVTVVAQIASTGGFVLNNGAPGVNTNPRCATNALDEVAVYSSALSAARIATHYAVGVNRLLTGCGVGS